jgi:CBS domain-containing protein
MLIRDRMSRPVITIAADRTVRDAERLLVRHRIRQLPVMRGTHLVGIVTHRDLRTPGPPSRSVTSVMTAKPITVGADAAIDEAAQVLRTYKIGGLPVVERKQLIGIITVADVLDALVALSGVQEATYRIVVSGRGGATMEMRARRAIERAHGVVRWLHRDPRPQPQEIHLRVEAARIERVLTALAAARLAVLRVVPAPRRG